MKEQFQMSYVILIIIELLINPIDIDIDIKCIWGAPLISTTCRARSLRKKLT